MDASAVSLFSFQEDPLTGGVIHERAVNQRLKRRFQLLLLSSSVSSSAADAHVVAIGNARARRHFSHLLRHQTEIDESSAVKCSSDEKSQRLLAYLLTDSVVVKMVARWSLGVGHVVHSLKGIR